MVTSWWAWAGLACGGGGFDATAIDDTRVVTIEADPAEALPGERVDLTVHVANPRERALDVMFWSCLLLDDACVEASYVQEVEEWVTLGTDAEGRMQTARLIPFEAQDWMAGGEASVSVQIFALACPVGACPVVDQARAAMDEPGLDPTLARRLAHPETWLAEIPMEGVSLATRAYPVISPDATTRNDNPTWDARFAESLDPPLRVEAGREIDLAFAVEDPDGEVVYAFPMSTVGSFESRKVEVEDDQVRLYLRAQDAPGEGRVWVVFDDRDGGLGVYSEEVVVE